MERSDKHSARLDDELKHETQGMVQAGDHATRVEEHRDPEPAGEDQPEVTRTAGGGGRGSTPEGMTAQDVQIRSQVASVLGLSAFPGDRDRLLEVARSNSAPDSVLSLLASLPQGERFANVQQVMTAAGFGVEERGY